MSAQEIFEKFWKTSPASLANVLQADMMVFYCPFDQAQSPATMTSYLNLIKI
jgi:hypothetical protein